MIARGDEGHFLAQPERSFPSAQSTNWSVPLNRSTAAFYFTCEKLFETSAHVYFWTFTFKKVYADWVYSYAFSAFYRDLSNRFGHMLLGVRVVEPHKSHGLHYHALLNQRIPMDLVRRIGSQYGIGICWVEKADFGSVHYLAKYLSKSKRKGQRLYKGIKRWATVGGFVGTRVRKMIVESEATDCMRSFVRIGGQLPTSFAACVYSYGRHYGRLDSWDFKARRQFCSVLARMAKPNQLRLASDMIRLALTEIGQQRRQYVLDKQEDLCHNVFSQLGIERRGNTVLP